MRERPRARRRVPEWELEPLKRAIRDIDDSGFRSDGQVKEPLLFDIFLNCVRKLMSLSFNHRILISHIQTKRVLHFDFHNYVRIFIKTHY